jgi:flagellin-like protein
MRPALARLAAAGIVAAVLLLAVTFALLQG